MRKFSRKSLFHSLNFRRRKVVRPSPASLQREKNYKHLGGFSGAKYQIPVTKAFGVIYLVHSIFNHIFRHKKSKEESGKTLVMPPYHFPLHCVDLVMNDLESRNVST